MSRMVFILYHPEFHLRGLVARNVERQISLVRCYGLSIGFAQTVAAKKLVSESSRRHTTQKVVRAMGGLQKLMLARKLFIFEAKTGFFLGEEDLPRDLVPYYEKPVVYEDIRGVANGSHKQPYWLEPVASFIHKQEALPDLPINERIQQALKAAPWSVMCKSVLWPVLIHLHVERHAALRLAGKNFRLFVSRVMGQIYIGGKPVSMDQIKELNVDFSHHLVIKKVYAATSEAEYRRAEEDFQTFCRNQSLKERDWVASRAEPYSQGADRMARHAEPHRISRQAITDLQDLASATTTWKLSSTSKVYRKFWNRYTRADEPASDEASSSTLEGSHVLRQAKAADERHAWHLLKSNKLNILNLVKWLLPRVTVPLHIADIPQKFRHLRPSSDVAQA